MNNEKLFNGYDKVKWGYTIDEVKSIYPELIEIKDENDLPGIRIIAYEYLFNKNNYLEGKYFKFFNNKLGLVSLFFYPPYGANEFEPELEKYLVNSLIEKYGHPNILDENQIVQNNDGTYCSTLILGINISPEMSIIINDIHTFDESTKEKIGHNMIYEYMNPKLITDFNENNVNSKYNIILWKKP